MTWPGAGSCRCGLVDVGQLGLKRSLGPAVRSSVQEREREVKREDDRDRQAGDRGRQKYTNGDRGWGHRRTEEGETERKGVRGNIQRGERGVETEREWLVIGF